MHTEEINLINDFCEVFHNNIKIEITTHKSCGRGLFAVGIRDTRKCLNAEKRIECFECYKNQ